MGKRPFLFAHVAKYSWLPSTCIRPKGDDLATFSTVCRERQASDQTAVVVYAAARACELLDKRIPLGYHFLGCQEYIYWRLFPLSGSDNAKFLLKTAVTTRGIPHKRQVRISSYKLFTFGNGAN